jgi:hypothetical protein
MTGEEFDFLFYRFLKLWSVRSGHGGVQGMNTALEDRVV